MAFLRRDRSVERLVDDDGRQAVVIEDRDRSGRTARGTSQWARLWEGREW
jgi:hypothetical protein